MAILPNGLNLSQAFIGNSEIQSAWLGNTKIWEKSGGRLPSAYQELSYIESTGTQYIDTNYNLNYQSLAIEMDVQVSNIKYSTLSGVQYTDTVYYWLLIRTDTQNNIILCLANNGQTFASESVISTSALARHNIIANLSNHGYNISVDGVNQLSGSDSMALSLQYSIPIFNEYYPSYTQSRRLYASMKLYKYKITADGTLTRNYVPCYRKSDGLEGLYDLVTQTFYHDPNNYRFTRGSEVN